MNDRNKAALDAFFDELTALCNKHGMSLQMGDDAIRIAPWRGWQDDRKVNPVWLKGPLLSVGIITPNKDDADIEYIPNGHL